MPQNRVGGPWSYNAICQVCGFKFKASDLLKRWDGLMVCRHDWEPRHPQEFIKAVPDNTRLPWTRPGKGAADVGPTYSCDFYDVQYMTDHQLETILQGLADTDNPQTYTVYKITTSGDTVEIPQGIIVDVVCTLTVG